MLDRGQQVYIQTGLMSDAGQRAAAEHNQTGGETRREEVILDTKTEFIPTSNSRIVT